MDADIVRKKLERALEKLAEAEHERWSHWQRYLHGKGTLQPDGSLVLPAELVERWSKQFSTPYDELSASEKESDREQVQKYLPIIVDTLTN
ncbi:MAG: hypothetical protein ACOY5F_20575 [Pseudomonadota bacterium]